MFGPSLVLFTGGMFYTSSSLHVELLCNKLVYGCSRSISLSLNMLQGSVMLGKLSMGGIIQD